MATKRPSRRERIEASHTSLDNLLGWQTAEAVEPTRAKGRVVRGGIIATIASALFASAMALPFIGASAITINQAADYWAQMPTTLPDVPVPTRSVMLAADGTQIAQFYSENRVEVTSDEVPQVMKDAVVAIEDSRFYDHHGVDFRGIARAAVTNLLTDSTQGGSTLTQQYVKNRLASAAEDDKTRQEVTSRTSYLRKLREARLAIELEKRWSKDQILLGYLNIAYYGDGAYGIGTAARHYFNTSVSDLTTAQAALLAGLVQNPTGYDPTNHKDAARTRRDIVLTRMHDLDYLSDRAYRHAMREPVRLDLTEAHSGCYTSRYPFFCQWVKTRIESDPVFGRTQAQRNERLFRGGMVIRTTLDPVAQDIAQDAVDEALGRKNRVAAAAVTVEPGTGNIVAFAVNRTFGVGKPGTFDKTEVVLPAVQGMQPGSNFKPFTLAAALERGYDPATTWTAPDVYRPAGMNYPGDGFVNSAVGDAGTLNAAQALWRSSNTWFVHLEEQVGVLNVASMAERLGITSLPRTGPTAITARDASLTLGAYEVSPLEMAGAYATFAAHGVHCTPVGITSITGPGPDTDNGAADVDVAVPDADCHEAIPASVADTVADIMQGTIDGPDPYRTGADETIGRPAAGKTGTTQSNAAVWFSGYTPQYATSVWVGDPRGGFAHPLQNFTAYGQTIAKAYGGTVAGPIWKAVMLGLHRHLPVEQFTKPTTTVSTGTVTPDVRGLTLDAAYRALSDAGFEVVLSDDTANDDKVLGPDLVASTNPAGGTFLGLATEVTITMTAGSDARVRLP